MLIDEPPLVVQPTLAKIMGLSEAIMLQKIHWLCANNPGEKWRRLSLTFLIEVFPFLSRSAVHRVRQSLLRQRFLIEGPAKPGSDRAKYYRINYKKLEKLSTAKVWDNHVPESGLGPESASSSPVVAGDSDDTDETMSRNRDLHVPESGLDVPESGLDVPESGLLDVPESGHVYSQTHRDTHTTTQEAVVVDNSEGGGPDQALPPGPEYHPKLNKPAWQKYLAYRAEHKLAALTDDTVKRDVALLIDFDADDQAGIIDQVVAKGYKGLFRPAYPMKKRRGGIKPAIEKDPKADTQYLAGLMKLKQKPGESDDEFAGRVDRANAKRLDVGAAASDKRHAAWLREQHESARVSAMAAG